VGCGGGDDGGIDLTDLPDIEDPAPPPPPPPEAFPVVGDTVYAVDLDGRLLTFGTGSTEQVSRATAIRGVPILHRIVGMDWRPADGRLYGVGNDSRVYVIDLEAATATPVSTQQFSPRVSLFFDVHFGMAIDPDADKIRLISAESGVNWEIDPDDGTAVQLPSPRFAEGDANEGVTPRIAGMAYGPPPSSAALAPGATIPTDCDRMLWAIDANVEWMMGSCDPDDWDFESLFEFGFAFAPCAEFAFDKDGNLFATLLDAVNGVNKLGKIDPDTGDVEWNPDVNWDSPIQVIVFVFNGGSSNAGTRHAGASAAAAHTDQFAAIERPESAGPRASARAVDRCTAGPRG
jgi:hypothetical protein